MMGFARAHPILRKPHSVVVLRPMAIRFPFLSCLVLAAALAALAAAPAHADLKLCNRMSYVAEGAIGIEQGNAVATRGWFRVDPGQCRDVAQGDLQFDHLYVHAPALPVYSESPLPRRGNAGP